MTSFSSSNMEFACVFYDVFGVGGFTGLMVVVGDRVIGSIAVLSRGALDELLDRIVRRELKPVHPCIIFFWFLFGSSPCEIWSLWSFL